MSLFRKRLLMFAFESIRIAAAIVGSKRRRWVGVPTTSTSQSAVLSTTKSTTTSNRKSAEICKSPAIVALVDAPTDVLEPRTRTSTMTITPAERLSPASNAVAARVGIRIAAAFVRHNRGKRLGARCLHRWHSRAGRLSTIRDRRLGDHISFRFMTDKVEDFLRIRLSFLSERV